MVQRLNYTARGDGSNNVVIARNHYDIRKARAAVIRESFKPSKSELILVLLSPKGNITRYENCIGRSQSTTHLGGIAEDLVSNMGIWIHGGSNFATSKMDVRQMEQKHGQLKLRLATRGVVDIAL